MKNLIKLSLIILMISSMHKNITARTTTQKSAIKAPTKKELDTMKEQLPYYIIGNYLGIDYECENMRCKGPEGKIFYQQEMEEEMKDALTTGSGTKCKYAQDGFVPPAPTSAGIECWIKFYKTTKMGGFRKNGKTCLKVDESFNDTADLCRVDNIREDFETARGAITLRSDATDSFYLTEDDYRTLDTTPGIKLIPKWPTCFAPFECNYNTTVIEKCDDGKPSVVFAEKYVRIVREKPVTVPSRQPPHCTTIVEDQPGGIGYYKCTEAVGTAKDTELEIIWKRFRYYRASQTPRYGKCEDSSNHNKNDNKKYSKKDNKKVNKEVDNDTSDCLRWCKTYEDWVRDEMFFYREIEEITTEKVDRTIKREYKIRFRRFF